MIKEAYQRGFTTAFEKLAIPMPKSAWIGGAAGKAAKSPTVPAMPRRAVLPAKERVLDYRGWAHKAKPAGAESTIDYSSWAHQPTSYKPPKQVEPIKPLSPKAQDAMKAFNYRPGVMR